MVRVELLKGVGQGLDHNAALNEVVEADSRRSRPVEFPNKQVIKPVTQSVSESSERLLQLVPVDRPGIVLVEGAESFLPIANVLPQSAELVEVDCPGQIPVEHSDHEADRFWVESRPGPIPEGFLQLIGRYGIALVSIHFLEDLPEEFLIRSLRMSHRAEKLDLQTRLRIG